jgi:threonine dehydrogenase-like Zn-dependent dehydrogenase
VLYAGVWKEEILGGKWSARRSGGLTVRQLTCTGPGVIEWCEVSEPEVVVATDALVRPVAVARCDLDPFLVEFGPQRADRFALGHEAVVEVVAVGQDVKAVAIGTLALPSFEVSCGSCHQCVSGKSALCSEYPILSDYGMEPLSGVEYGGMLSDLVRVPHADTMLTLMPPGLDPVAVASVPDNVLDGYRLVAPHLERRPAADVVIACHRGRSIGLYAAQTAVALGAGSVTVASADEAVLGLAGQIGTRPLRVDFTEPPEATWPLVVDCTADQPGFQWSIRATEPEGTLQCMGNMETAVPVDLLRLYTLGIELHLGRAHSAALLPEVVTFVADGRLRPEAVTTDVVDWEDAPKRYLDPAVKLIVDRSA